MARPLSPITLKAILLCEEHAGLTYTQLQTMMPECSNANMTARRAVKRKLLRSNDDRPRKYFAVEGWRTNPLVPKEMEQAHRHLETPKLCSFVFNMGCLEEPSGVTP